MFVADEKIRFCFGTQHENLRIVDSDGVGEDAHKKRTSHKVGKRDCEMDWKSNRQDEQKWRGSRTANVGVKKMKGKSLHDNEIH